jgi:hypothetical protein
MTEAMTGGAANAARNPRQAAAAPTIEINRLRYKLAIVILLSFVGAFARFPSNADMVRD